MASTSTKPRRRGSGWKVPAGMLTPRQVFDEFGIAEQTLANWRSKGKGPEWKKIAGQVGVPGGMVVYPRKGVQQFMAGRTVTTTDSRRRAVHHAGARQRPGAAA